MPQRTLSWIASIVVLILVGTASLFAYDRMLQPLRPTVEDDQTLRNRIGELCWRTEPAAAAQVEQALSQLRDRTPREDFVAMAADAGNLPVLEVLLRNGYSVDGIYRDQTPVFRATTARQERAVRYLVGRGATFAKRPRRAESPLYAAIYANDIRMVLTLVELGVSLNDPISLMNHLRTSEYQALEAAGIRCRTETITPLMCAARFDRSELVLCLLYRGANPNARSAQGRTALEYARLLGSKRSQKLLANATLLNEIR